MKTFTVNGVAWRLLPASDGRQPRGFRTMTVGALRAAFGCQSLRFTTPTNPKPRDLKVDAEVIYLRGGEVFEAV